MSRVTTTCPQCSTIFRVNPEQLAARRGQVRCGRCRHVFNGYETVSVGPDLPEPDLTPTASPAGRGSWLSWLRRRRTSRPAVPQQAAGSLRPEGLTKMVELVRTGPDPKSVEPGALRIRPAFGMELEKVSDDFSLPGARRRKRAMAVVVAAMVIGVPAGLLAARQQIIQWQPAVRPAYLAVCGAIQCEVPLPAEAEAWSVESNELLVDASDSRLYHFTATLRNRSAYPQAYPSVDLILTDAQGMTVERHPIPPAQYLPANRPARQGMAPNAEVAIRTDIRPADTLGTDYRVVPFYP